MKQEMRVAFTSHPFNIPHKYNYDETGSVLYEELIKKPEYYLTRVETGILRERAKDIMKLVVPNELVELGSGSSTKTRLLLEAMHGTGRKRYIPIDISETALYQATVELSADYDWLEIEGHVGDYHKDLPLLQKRGKRLLTFLGSSIGNYTEEGRKELLKQMRAALGPGDALLLGVDLVKEEGKMVSAYKDSAAQFVLNILNVINRELDADFKVQKFTYNPSWNPEECCIESYIVAQEDMIVSIRALDMSIKLSKDEKILTAISCKFRREVIACELADVGLEVVQWFNDSSETYGLLLACPKMKGL